MTLDTSAVPAAAAGPDAGLAAAPAAYDPTVKQKAQAKTARIPIKIVAAETLKKPDWIRVKAG